MRRLRDRVHPKIFVVPVHDSPTNPKSAVPIPARFLNTESSTLSMALPMDEISAAIKIQSAFRGFSTRKCAPLKNLKIIHDVKAKAEDVRRHISDRQVVESIRQNEKERLKITEEIMSLILKLDAIQYPPVFSSDFARPPENPFFIMRRLRDRVQPKIFAVPVHDSPTNPKSAVPIPARFLNTESSTLSMAVPMDETSAAIKIQSAFRGFSTRKCAPLKNLKIIHDVKAKAEDVRRHIADRQVVESIRQNEKERLKITEEIMSLILKLDAIQVSCLVSSNDRSTMQSKPFSCYS